MSSLPWDDIVKPIEGFAFQRSSLSEKYHFWWGKSSENEHVLMFELANNYSETYKKYRPEVRGLRIDLVPVDSGGKCGLIIKLLQLKNTDLFYYLCRSLIYSVNNTDNEQQAVISALNNMKRWRDFFATAKKSILSTDEVMGLIGELITLQKLNSEFNLKYEEVLTSWVGPKGLPQDFKFEQGLIEVKAYNSEKKRTVKISSEFQLDPIDNQMNLVCYNLTKSKNDDGRTLNTWVKETASMFPEDKLNEFYGKLLMAGYLECEEYDLDKFTLSGTSTYNVLNNFPCIRASDIPSTISNIRYDLAIDQLFNFRIPSINIFNGD